MTTGAASTPRNARYRRRHLELSRVPTSSTPDCGSGCEIIGEEDRPDGKVWFVCPDDGSPSPEAECEETLFGVKEKLCKVDKVSA